MRSIVLLIVISFGVSLAWGPGSASATFLKLSVDARACAMGEAQTAYCNNISSMYYNPAGLGQIGKIDMLFMHNHWFMNMFHEYFAIGFAPEKIGSFGLSFNYWGSGSIQGFDERSDTIRINGAPYTFSSSDWALAFGYGQALEKILLGVAAKFISEKNESLSASGLGLDLGAKFIPVNGFTFGTSISNMGTRLKLDQLSFPIPLIWRLGLGYRRKALGFAWDLIISNSDNVSTGLGLEYWIVEVFALRFGYKNGSNVDGISGIRVGTGLKYKGFGIDYAFAPYGSLGMTHRFSFAYGIEPLPKPSRIRKPIKRK